MGTGKSRNFQIHPDVTNQEELRMTQQPLAPMIQSPCCPPGKEDIHTSHNSSKLSAQPLRIPSCNHSSLSLSDEIRNNSIPSTCPSLN
jgi:hypothetical protein